MGNDNRWDVARQAANVIGAVFQVGMTAVASAAIQEETGRSAPLIEPALYAFFVWGVIFTLSLAYAIYQALPASRDNPLLRGIGPYTAVAFFCIGLWSVFVPQQLLLAALTMLAITFACLLVVYLRLARSEHGGFGTLDRWLVAPMVGVYLGWITAANVVSVDSEAVRFGLVEGGTIGEAVMGSVLLLLGTALACAVILAGAAGPVQGYLAYGATVLWALIGIVAGQYDASLFTTGAALLAAGMVAVVLFIALRGGGTPARAVRRAPV